MTSLFVRFIDDKTGATAIEYALIAAVIAIVVFSALTIAGQKLSSKFNPVAAALN
jgi:pilus assembly protein Flp/PilA